MPSKPNTFCEKWLDENTITLAESGCMIYMKKLNKKGYAQSSKNNKTVEGHRAAYEARFGPIPKGMCVCHRCDTPSCVNPDHMFLGTHRDNTLDASKKARLAHGEKHKKSKLTDDQVRAIRRETGSYDEIAKAYGVCSGTIRNIRLRLTWRHITL